MTRIAITISIKARTFDTRTDFSFVIFFSNKNRNSPNLPRTAHHKNVRTNDDDIHVSRRPRVLHECVCESACVHDKNCRYAFAEMSL